MSSVCVEQRLHLLVPQLAPTKHVGVVSGVAHELPLEEGHVEAGRVVVDELEEEHLHRQLVLVLQVRLGDFCQSQKREAASDTI